MIQPIKYKERVAINSLTGIKSSLPQIRSVVALTYLLYLASGKKASVAYSIQNSSQGLSLNEEYMSSIKDLLASPNVDELIVSNPLLKSQIESLYVGLTLMYGLGRVSFVNTSYGMTVERTGGVRYPKKIDFASNMILLDLIMQSIDESERKSFLIAWLNNQQAPNEIELRVSTFLNVCIENNLFKLRNGDKDTYFQTEGLYLALKENETVSLESDEIVGPARILNGMLKEGLIPWLSIKNSIVSVNKETQFNVESFCKITSTSLDIRDIKVDVKEELSLENNNTDEEPLRNILQQIFYGAPGTGKSNTIKRKVDDQGKFNYRTTFHPDSDYSTFVGCYKPKMKRSTITKDGVTTTEEKIIYSFEPQAFTNAYVQAWKSKDDVYLIIEEINRGNCAQIFGDLFQLLDRKNGESEYPVDADTSLADFLQTALAESRRDDIPAEVKNGTRLKLPSNLYIWATMNTSDQSLFPIDSAFKRRWEWKYMKIKNEGKEWKIDLKIKDANREEKLVDWWDFIRKVNDIIASMTSSADKQLGYFFCKADKKTNEQNNENDLISVDTFVSKVLFYLWNDVFKDYGFEDASLFQYTKTEDGKETKKDLTFPDFYKEDSNDVNPEMVTDFVQKVMNWKKKEEEKN